MSLRACVAAALALLAAAPAALATQVRERGHDPWAFRAVLDERPRMLVLALAPNFWVAYDAERASLYKVWEGGVHFTGAVYDWLHGPQPTSQGRAWLVSPWEEPWEVKLGERVLPARVRWRGHRLHAGGVTLLYDVEAPGAPPIRVTESPDVLQPAGETRFVRVFTTAGVPAGAELRLRVSLPAGAPFGSEGRFEAEAAAAGASVDGVLTLRANATTRTTLRLGEPALPEAPPPSAAADAPRGQALAEASDCRVCHDPVARTIGPSFREIAERYPDDPVTTARLARKVIVGGAGVWGEAVMTPHPQLSPADAETMVAWILAQADPPVVELEAWRRLPTWMLGPIVSVYTWWFGEAGPHGIDVTRQLPGVHPSFTLEHIRPEGFEPRVGGLAVLPDGALLVASWEAAGGVYRLDGQRVTRIAAGLLEPLGLAVVDGAIYVQQKHELTRLVDEDGDGTTDLYETVSDQWRCSANFHEFSFGLAHEGGRFYANLATAVQPGGKSVTDQAAGRGSVVAISPADGKVEVMGSGLRAPNGVGAGAGGRLFVTDNQGDWLPASKLLLVAPGVFYGSHNVGFPHTEQLAVTPPVVWMPYAEVANSPSQPLGIELGPWRGQLLVGDVHYGGLQRVFVEEVEGVLQGTVFRFSQGFEAGVNRLAWGADGKLYVGEIGGPGDWGQPGKLWFGLERLAYNGRPTFELLAVRVRSGGVEVELTEPLGPAAPRPADFALDDYRYQPTAEYGGPKVDTRMLAVTRVEVAPDRRRLRLAVDGLAAGRVLHLEVAEGLRSARGEPLWSREAWSTVNHLAGGSGDAH